MHVRGRGESVEIGSKGVRRSWKVSADAGMKARMEARGGRAAEVSGRGVEAKLSRLAAASGQGLWRVG